MHPNLQQIKTLCMLTLFVCATLTGYAQAPSAFNDALNEIQNLAEEQQPQANPGMTKSAVAEQNALTIGVAQPRTDVPDSKVSLPPKFPKFSRWGKNVLKKPGKTVMANTIVTPHLRCLYTRSHDMIWRDKGTGGAFDLGVWRPKCPSGWVRLGDIAVPSMSENCPDAPALLVQWNDSNPAGDEKGPFLKKPVDYQWRWDDKKSGADWDGSFWYPVPPKGYVSLGVVTQRNHSKPTDYSIMRCVRSDLVYPGKWVGTIWTDKKSGAKNDCAVWSQKIADKYKNLPYLMTNTFHVAGNYDYPPSAQPYVIIGLSAEDAYNDALNGYLKVTRNGIINRTQLAVENAADARQTVLKTETEELKKKIAQAENVQSVDRKPDKSSEKLEGNTTSSHKIPSASYSSEEFSKITARLKALGSKVGIDTIPGLQQLPFLKGVEINNVVFSQGEITAGGEKGQPWMCLSGNTSLSFNLFGKTTGKIIVLSRLYKELGLRTGFVMVLPSEIVTSKLPGMNSKPLNMLKFSQAAATFATEEHEWEFTDLPDQIRSIFNDYAGDNNSTFSFDKGENVWLTSELKNNSLLATPFTVLNAVPPRVLFTAVFPQEKDESFKLKAKLLNSYSASFLPTGKFLKLTPPSLEIAFGSFQGVSLSSILDLSFSSSLNLSIPVKIDFPLGCKPMIEGVSVSGLIPGTWKNPFGIKGLAIGNMSISGTFGKLPNLALGGIIDLGKGYKFDLAGALSFTSPIALSALRCKLDHDLSLGALIEIQGLIMKVAFPTCKIPTLAEIKLPIDELKIRDPEFCISEVDVPALNIKQGLTFKGTLVFGTVDLGGADVWMLAEKGIQCKAWVKGFKIANVGISGAGPDKKNFTSDDNPIIDLEYWPLTQAPFTLSQHCYLSGRADIIKADMNIFIDVAKDKITADLNGDFGSALNIQLTAEGKHELLKDVTKGGSLYFSGEVKSSFIDNLESKVSEKVSKNSVVQSAIQIVGNSVLKIKSVKVSGSLDDFSKGNLPKLEVLCSAFGQGFTISFPTNFPNANLTDKLVEKIAEKVIDIANDLIKDPLKFVGNVCNNIANLGQDVADDLTKAFGRSPAEQWKSANAEAARQAENAKKVAETGAKIAADTAKKAVSVAEDTAKKVADTMSDIASGAWDEVSSWF